MDGLAVSFDVMFQFLFSGSCVLIDVYVCSYVFLMYDMFSSHVYDIDCYVFENMWHLDRLDVMFLG